MKIKIGGLKAEYFANGISIKTVDATMLIETEDITFTFDDEIEKVNLIVSDGKNLKLDLLLQEW